MGTRIESLKRGVRDLSSAFAKFQENKHQRHENIIQVVVATVKDQVREQLAAPRKNQLDSTDLEKIVLTIKGTIKEAEDRKMDRMGRVALEFDRKLIADTKERKTQKELLKAFVDYIQATTRGMTTRMDEIERQLRHVAEKKVLMRHTVDSHTSIISDLIVEA